MKYFTVTFGAIILLLAVHTLGESTPGWGGDLLNSKWNNVNSYFRLDTIDEATLFCSPYTGADTSGIPSISEDGIAYFPAWNGRLFGILLEDCSTVLNVTVESITSIENDISRTTPTIWGDSIIVGGGQGPNYTAKLAKTNRYTGAVDWVTLMDDHPAAVITTSPTIGPDGVIFGGVSSREEALAANPQYDCCSFRGSSYAVNAETGAIIWKRYHINEEWSGNAHWGSAPAVDHIERAVYIATGNEYVENPAITACVDALVNPTKELVDACLGPDNDVNAVMSLSMDTGTTHWRDNVGGPDPWNVACIVPTSANCPENAGPDFDFGQSPMLIKDVLVNGHIVDITVTGQKSGNLTAHIARNGTRIWQLNVGPGSSLGGLEWGSAYDDTGIYTANANRDYADWVLPNGTIACGGAVAKVSYNGTLIWIVPDPFSVLGADECEEQREEIFGLQLPAPFLKKRIAEDSEEMRRHNMRVSEVASANMRKRNAPGHAEGPLAYFLGPVSLVNDIFWAGSMTGFLYGFDTATGAIVWEYDTGGSVNAAPSFWNRYMITLSGYERFGLGPENDRVFIFRLPESASEDTTPRSPDYSVFIVIGILGGLLLIAIVCIIVVWCSRCNRYSRV